jgi:hypothetical protein
VKSFSPPDGIEYKYHKTLVWNNKGVALGELGAVVDRMAGKGKIGTQSSFKPFR